MTNTIRTEDLREFLDMLTANPGVLPDISKIDPEFCKAFKESVLGDLCKTCVVLNGALPDVLMTMMAVGMVLGVMLESRRLDREGQA